MFKNLGRIILISTCIISILFTLMIIFSPIYYNVYMENTSDIESIALRMAEEKEYVVGVYDCSEFSEYLVDRYNQLGWNATTKHVDVNCTMEPWNRTESCSGSHLIVELNNVYIEATRGYIIHPDQYRAWGIEE